MLNKHILCIIKCSTEEKIKMNKITSALFMVFASLALAMPAYTEDFKLEQEQLREITNNLEQLNENQLIQRKAYLLQQLEVQHFQASEKFLLLSR